MFIESLLLQEKDMVSYKNMYDMSMEDLCATVAHSSD